MNIKNGYLYCLLVVFNVWLSWYQWKLIQMKFDYVLCCLEYILMQQPLVWISIQSARKMGINDKHFFYLHPLFFRENNHWTWQGIAASEIYVMQISVLHCSAENLTTCSNALIYLAVVQHILLEWALAFRLFWSVIPFVTYYVFYQGYWISNIGVLGPVSLWFKMS